MKNNKFVASVLGGVAIAGTLFPAPVNAAESQTAKIKVTAAETLSIALSANEVDFSMGQSDLMKKNITVTGSTNSQAGYSISFATANDYNSMKHAVSSVTDNIPSITEDKTEATFPTLGWGYSVDAVTFSEIPLTQKNIFSTDIYGTNEHTFTTGVRIAEDIVAGDYENDLLFTIIANITPMDLESITYLQQMTPDICAAAPDNLEKQLIDKRDNKKYWVKKYSNGECWMVQNLDFALPVGTVLSPSTSDVLTDITVTETDFIENGNWYFENGTTLTSADGLSDTDTRLHYHVGNNYSFFDATQMDRSRLSDADFERDEDIQGSICPKGWRLPISPIHRDKHDSTEGVEDYAIDGLFYDSWVDETSIDEEHTLFDYASYNSHYWTSSIALGPYVFYHPTEYNTFDQRASIRCIAK